MGQLHDALSKLNTIVAFVLLLSLYGELYKHHPVCPKCLFAGQPSIAQRPLFYPQQHYWLLRCSSGSPPEQCIPAVQLQNAEPHIMTSSMPLQCCGCLCVFYDEGSADLCGLNGCRQPSNSASVENCLVRGERHKVEGSERGRAQVRLPG